MKKPNFKIISVLFLSYIFLSFIIEDDILKKGTSLILYQYNAKGKKTGTLEYSFSKITINDTLKVISTLFENKDHKKFVIQKNNSFVIDSKTNLYYSLDFFTPATGDDTVFKFNSEKYMNFPKKIGSDSTLTDLKREFEMVVTNTDGRTNSSIMAVKLYDRKLIASEKIETPIGEIDCLVMSFKYAYTKTLGSYAIYKIWYNAKYGIVKIETYSKKGKLSRKSILSDYNFSK